MAYTASIAVMHFFGEAHQVAEGYLRAVVENGFAAHLSEDLMLVGYEQLEIELCRAVEHRDEIRFKPPVG